MKQIVYVLGLLDSWRPAHLRNPVSSITLNVGVYGNFFHLSDSDIDLAGVGARVSVNIMPKIQLEAESAYNFEAAYSQGFSDYNGTVTVSTSHVRSLDGLFGPKF